MKNLETAEITLNDIKELILRYNFRLLIFPVVAAILAVLINSRRSGHWEAIASIKIGQVNTKYVEAPPRMLSRAIQPLFISAVMERVPKQEDKELIKSKYQEFIKFDYLGEPQILQVKTKAPTKGIASQLSQYSIEQMISDHGTYFEKQTADLRSKIDKAVADLQGLKAKNDILLSELTTRKLSSTDIILREFLIDNRNAEISRLERVKYNLSEKLNPDDTFKSHQNEETLVRMVSVFPSNMHVAVLAFIMCLIFSLVTAYVHSIYKRDVSSKV
ncbi:MAG TPA: hypothetical protein VNJ08_02985 [Bacteriovoracaceae bacterium]|nr:hypothetical protein [Bacteriovoracaceae bacterium]